MNTDTKTMLLDLVGAGFRFSRMRALKGCHLDPETIADCWAALIESQSAPKPQPAIVEIRTPIAVVTIRDTAHLAEVLLCEPAEIPPPAAPAPVPALALPRIPTTAELRARLGIQRAAPRIPTTAELRARLARV